MAEKLPVVIGNQIMKARMRKGWTQTDLCKKVGLGPGTVSRYEAGARRAPHFKNLMRIADATDVSVDFLLGRENAPMVDRIRDSGLLDAIDEYYTATLVALAKFAGVPVECLLGEQED